MALSARHVSLKRRLGPHEFEERRERLGSYHLRNFNICLPLTNRLLTKQIAFVCKPTRFWYAQISVLRRSGLLFKIR